MGFEPKVEKQRDDPISYNERRGDEAGCIENEILSVSSK